MKKIWNEVRYLLYLILASFHMSLWAKKNMPHSCIDSRCYAESNLLNKCMCHSIVPWWIILKINKFSFWLIMAKYILNMNLLLRFSIIKLYLLPLIYELGIWISFHYYVYSFLKSLSGMVSWFIVVNFSQGSHQCGAARAVHPGPWGQPVHESVCVQESQWKLRKLLLLRSLLEHEISQLCHRAHHQGNNSDAI